MQKYNWNYPTTMWVGENRINDIAIACQNLAISKPLLVTDKGLAETDIVKNTLTILKDNKISTELYSEMKLQGRFELIRECPVNDLYVGQTFEDAFREIVMTILRGEVAGKIKNMLGKATIRFGDNNEISERSVGGKPSRKCNTT